MDGSYTGTGQPGVMLGGGFGATAGGFPYVISLWSGRRLNTPSPLAISDVAYQGVLALHLRRSETARPNLPSGVYVGGNFYDAGGVSVSGLALWSNGQWRDVGGGVKWPSNPKGGAPRVKTIEFFGTDPQIPQTHDLYVGGVFEAVGEDQPIPALAAWDGASWRTVGGGLSHGNSVLPTVYDLQVFDDDAEGSRIPALYVSGSFKYAGGQQVNHIARWDGSSWEPLAQGMSSTPVDALCVFDEDGSGLAAPALFAGGSFRVAGQPEIMGLARWNGASWSLVGAPLGTVYTLAAFDDDGPGPNKPSLFAGGHLILNTPGGVANRIARWDGSQWHKLGFGLSGFGAGTSAQSLGVFDEDGPGPNPGGLYVGGLFYYAGEEYTYHIARWGCPQAPQRTPCDPDCNNDDALNLADFGCFLSNFAYRTPYADTTEEGQWNIADLQAFQSRFAAGCP